MYYGFNFAFGSPWASTGAPWCPGTRTRAGPERRGARAPGTGARARPGGGERSAPETERVPAAVREREPRVVTRPEMEDVRYLVCVLKPYVLADKPSTTHSR